MFDNLQNCLLGQDAAILRFYPSCNLEIGEVVLYQPLDQAHPVGVWYEARVSWIRESGYVELEPLIKRPVGSDEIVSPR